MTDLIAAQRAYEMNATVITASDEMLAGHRQPVAHGADLTMSPMHESP